VVGILLYADDKLFILDEGLENARNLKFLLVPFEQMSSFVLKKT
jgi:hypothetical protein